ncbi:hypothetical protein [Nocardia sp. alder85J]|uniref:hypothetical protein n=1 Tax=Nocardia sp. alder85J TaxID=2862949 RepID=UPI001CD32B9C|nr:hypothetical protein [Nocardia sp. alder85J]MCX4090928.1 hypothetical protein [Nocardia sp. alder85J]
MADSIHPPPPLGFRPGPSAPPRRTGPVLVAGCVFALVVVLLSAAVLRLDHGSRGTARPVAPQPAAAAPESDCTAVSSISVLDARFSADSLEVTLGFTTPCAHGALLSSNHASVTVASSSVTVAAGIFDLSAAPVTVPAAPGSARRTFRFPIDMYWLAPDTVPVARLHVDADQLSGATPPSGSVSSSGETAVLTAVAPAAGDAEAAAIAGLRAIADADHAVVSRDLADRWVPQLSSKRIGLVAEGVTWSDARILHEYLQLRSRYPDARLLWSGAWSTFSSPDFWITVVGTAFPTGAGALGWCAGNGFDRDHCYAKLVSTTHPVPGSTEYR